MEDGTGTPRWAIEYLQDLGWSRVAATALVANLMWESGGHGNIEWAAHGDKSRKDGEFHSHGAGQWNDKHGRWQNLQAYAKQQGTPWQDPATQLRFLDTEMRTSERTVRNNLLKETELDRATALAALRFWRPSIPHIDRRVQIANALAEEDDTDGGTQVASVSS